MTSLDIEQKIESLAVLIADSSTHMRKLLRTMLVNGGVKAIYEAVDGVAALDGIRNVSPDVMILNWNMPLVSGPEILRIVRSPGVFPKPNLPIIMLTDDGIRSRVLEAARLGVHELLITPISAKVLQERLLGFVVAPRPMVRAGNHYIPLPRRHSDLKEVIDLTTIEPVVA